jgi:hypothetical protein
VAQFLDIYIRACITLKHCPPEGLIINEQYPMTAVAAKISVLNYDHEAFILLARRYAACC